MGHGKGSADVEQEKQAASIQTGFSCILKKEILSVGGLQSMSSPSNVYRWCRPRHRKWGGGCLSRVNIFTRPHLETYDVSNNWKYLECLFFYLWLHGSSESSADIMMMLIVPDPFCTQVLNVCFSPV